MISEIAAKMKCKDDISLIENYEEAVNDKTNMWECHHRWELTLDGEFANSIDDLKRMGMYFKRPYFELIFLEIHEHHDLHNLANKKANRGLDENRLGNYVKQHGSNFKGKKHTKETKDKMSKLRIGMKFTEEHCKNISLGKKGQKHTAEWKEWFKNESSKFLIRTEFGRKYFEHTGLRMKDDKHKYWKERGYYLKNGKCRWE